MLDALKFGQAALQDIVKLQQRMREAIGKPKFELAPVQSDGALREVVANAIGGRFEQMRSALRNRLMQAGKRRRTRRWSPPTRHTTTTSATPTCRTFSTCGCDAS
jgi:polyribonucleotide nucleotidyltransferase